MHIVALFLSNFVIVRKIRKNQVPISLALQIILEREFFFKIEFMQIKNQAFSRINDKLKF